MGRAKKSGTTDLEATRGSLANWRRQYGGRGRRIPQGFWDKARELARVYGVAETARALRLTPRRLAAVVDQTLAVAPKSVESEAFVELGGLQFTERGEAVVVELLGREGDCVRVQVSAKAVDIVALAGAFWSRRS